MQRTLYYVPCTPYSALNTTADRDRTNGTATGRDMNRTTLMEEMTRDHAQSTSSGTRDPDTADSGSDDSASQ